MLLAGIIGGASVISGEIVTKLLVWLGVGQYPVFELNSLLLTNNRPSMGMGFVLNAVIGLQVGVLFYLAFMKLGSEHIVIKCTCGSLILWFLFEALFTFVIEGKEIPERSISDHYVHFIGTAAYGLTVGVFLRLLLFRHSNEEK